MHKSELRAKYPKWAHRHDAQKRRSRKRRKRRRRSRRRRRAASSPTELMLVQLLGQLLGPTAPLSRKHGSNVVTGYADRVAPDSLAPVRSREYARGMRDASAPAGGAGAGAGAAAGFVPMPS